MSREELREAVARAIYKARFHWLSDVDIAAAFADMSPYRADLVAASYRGADATIALVGKACAEMADKEAAAMDRVADCHRIPRVEYDPHLCELHEQGACVARKLAAAILTLTGANADV